MYTCMYTCMHTCMYTCMYGIMQMDFHYKNTLLNYFQSNIVRALLFEPIVQLVRWYSYICTVLKALAREINSLFRVMRKQLSDTQG